MVFAVLPCVTSEPFFLGWLLGLRSCFTCDNTAPFLGVVTIRTCSIALCDYRDFFRNV